MKIILAEDNKVFRELLVMYLQTELHHKVIGEHKNGLQLLENKLLVEADIVLLDIEMPQLNGIQTMQIINNKYKWLKAIAITNYYEKAYLRDLNNSGFKGCVFKDSLFEDLGKAMIKVYSGGFSFPTDIT